MPTVPLGAAPMPPAMAKMPESSTASTVTEPLARMPWLVLRPLMKAAVLFSTRFTDTAAAAAMRPELAPMAAVTAVIWAVESASMASDEAATSALRVKASVVLPMVLMATEAPTPPLPPYATEPAMPRM
jgi:hypothetical protein